MPLAWNQPTGKLEKKAVLQTRRKVVREWGREGLGKGGKTFLKKSFSLPFQRLLTLSNPCSRFSLRRFPLGSGNFNFAGLPCGRDFVVWWATQNSMFLCLLKEKCPKKHDSSGIFLRLCHRERLLLS